MNIMSEIITDLEARADAVLPLLDKADKLQADIKSDRFNMQTINGELYPALHKVKREIENAQEEARRAVASRVNAYIADLEREDALDPDKLTDDCKLLNAGVTLNARDINTMLERNSGNRTMTQVILRYAREHDIDIGRTYYIGNEEAIRNARSLSGTFNLYIDHWMNTKKSREMIDKMFRS